MASKVTIFNKTLYKLKKARITNPSQSVELNDIYDTERDIVLAAHPWNFAKYWTSIAKDASTDNWQYSYAYTLPADPWCLRVLNLENDKAKWQVGGNRKLFTNVGSPLKICFIGREANVSRFSPGFVDALATKLAYEAGGKIAGISAARAKVLLEEYTGKIGTGRSQDGQEGYFMEIASSDLLDARD